MTKIVYRFIFIGICLLSLTVFSQDKRQEKGDRKFERYAYIDAIKVYENLVAKGYGNSDLFQKLGDAYYFNGELQQASKWYNALFGVSQQVPPEYYYRYAQTLKSVKSYEEADRFLKTFADKQQTDQRAKLAIENLDYLQKIEENSGSYDIALLNINSEYSDYGSAIYQNKLIFSSARDTGTVSKRIHSWTNHPFTSLYEAQINLDGTFGKVRKFNSTINTKFNEAVAVFTADGNTLYFTRNNYNKGIRAKDVHGTTLLKIYRSEKRNGKWTKGVELPFNSNEFNTAHPALSPDEKWLYFASDRQGGQGQSDLYKVAILDSGIFGNPISLGTTINTGGRENFPYISQDNILYFSSDGHPGLGGLDIFAVKILEDGSFGAVKNLGAPANSESDDFAFMINSHTKRGFLSSNRAMGYGKDDIYSVLEMPPKVLPCKQQISGMVYDENKHLSLPNAKISLYDGAFNLLSETTSDGFGYYEFTALVCGAKYRVNTRAEEYNTAEVAIELPLETGITRVDFRLEKSRIKVEKGDDLFKVLKLEPIYFDFDQSEIRPDAAFELAKIASVLEQYPTMRIDIRSHTDSRGNDNYNLKLSDKRAKSTRNWLIKQGLSGARIFAKGYGETQLINGCENGIKCTDAEHQENRRSEFIVLEL